MPQKMTEEDISLEEARKIIQTGKRGIFHIVFSRTMVILLTLLLQLILYFVMMFSLVQHATVLFGSIAAFTAAMLFIVLNSTENPSIKLSWSIVIAVLPLFGAVLYFFVRFDLGYRLEQKVLEKSMLESDIYVPDQTLLLQKVRVSIRTVISIPTKAVLQRPRVST